MPMLLLMQSVGLRSSETLLCTKCGKRASFFSPIGALCTTDALLGAAFHDWIPTHIRRSPDVARDGDDRPLDWGGQTDAGPTPARP